MSPWDRDSNFETVRAVPAERQGLSVDAGLSPVRSARSEPDDPDRVLVVTGRGAPGLPEPAQRRVRHGAGRRGVAVAFRTRSVTGTRPERWCRPSGKCRPFDVRCRRHRLRQRRGASWSSNRCRPPIEAGDRIHAVIRGSAINNDGSMKMGYAAPNPAAQADVIAEAHAVAGIDASQRELCRDTRNRHPAG